MVMKTNAMVPVVMRALVHPRGSVQLVDWNAGVLRRQAEDAQGADWPTLYQEGWRIRKVKVSPVGS